MPGVKHPVADRHRKYPMSEQKAAHAASRRILVLVAFGTLLVGASISGALPTKLVWNASPSIPTGLYLIKNTEPSRDDLVLVLLPEWARFIADKRQYLPSSIPALKRVSALSGDRVCRFGRSVFVNRVEVVTARLTDNQLRNMPHWRGCRTLLDDEVLLLADHRNSFDGRYFGVTKTAGIIGVAHPIWTNEK